ncbi:DNA repair protein RecN [Sandarakinorhabdus sp.]|uniref:DNA repair protein RecN n=1 Tax=Sandarakinorhabdus sp. TaxID=1916663 RepID=UPI00286D7B99|nr:DNA repair protein RecN [Sandarakinorhabdus sp.]
MLTALAIQNVVLIEALAIEFTPSPRGPGLAVLTGETGAGKSILLDALGLVLGSRADASLVRAGTDMARVVAEFSVAADHPARALLADNDLDADGAIILRRQLKADGGSRAFVNDQPVSAALLRELGGCLVEIHGQHDERGLLSPKGHRALLDQFGGLSAPLAATGAAWSAWREASAVAEAARERLAADQRDREWLDHAVAELEALDAQPGEEAELALARAAMQKGARLADDLTTISDLFGQGSAALGQGARRLDRISTEHPLLTAALEALDRALVEAGEAETRLAEAGDALDADPARLEQVESRLFELRGVARKHKVEAEALPDLAAALKARADALVAGVEGLVALDAAVKAAEAAYGRAAVGLSAARAKAAVRLDAAVAAELKPLKLDTARFRTRITPLPASEWGPEGQERAEYEIATNPGADFAPLIKIASGGELSRFILALKVALASAGSAGTMIFDEIDRGVGGAVASAIGDRLARLADEAQVLVVTHSPQVAARGHTQWRIEKTVDAGITRTRLAQLDGDARQEEIARMLSGADVTPEARAQAARLLEGV